MSVGTTSAETEFDVPEAARRLRVEMEAYSSKYRMLPWLGGWNDAVEESKEHKNG